MAIDLSGISLWLQGLFGGAGATLLWEGILKPHRDRRSLAHVLAVEISHNLQYAVGQRLYLNENPKGLPGDFRLSNLVFQSVADRVGDLQDLAGDVVLICRQVDELNALPEGFTRALDQYLAARGTDQRREVEARAQLDSILSVYRTGLETLIGRLNAVLPQLRRRSIAWYRPDQRLAKPKLLKVDDVRKEVAAIAAIRRQT